MSYSTSLITTAAEVSKLAGIQHLDNLEADSAFTLADLLLEAHREVFRRVKNAGIDPTLLTNETHLESAVAFEAARRLALAGFLTDIGEDRMELADRYQAAREDQLTNSFTPETTAADAPSHGLGTIPVVGNFNDRWSYPGIHGSQTYSTKRPRRI